MRNEIEDHQKLKLFLRKDPLYKQNSTGTNQRERDKAQKVMIKSKKGNLNTDTTNIS